MKDVLEEVIEYLDRVPTGTATVSIPELKAAFRGRGKGIVYLRAKEWAAQQGYVMTLDNEKKKRLATCVFFKRK